MPWMIAAQVWGGGGSTTCAIYSLGNGTHKGQIDDALMRPAVA